jgi:hypothetical protein
MAMNPEVIDKYIEQMREREAEQMRSSDRWELKRLNDMIARLQEELNLYGDFQLWLKFTYPDIINEYKCINDIKESSNGS